MANPFDDPSNPFQDPSIASALNDKRQDNFELDHKVEDDLVQDTNYHQVNVDQDPFQSSSSQPSTSVYTAQQSDDIQQREETLRRKEQELADRERALQEQQRRGRRGGANNFPPCFPLMYLDINNEIPNEHQWTVWWLYREWLLFEITLVLNFIACLIVLFSHPPSVTSAPTNMGVALTEMFTHTLASFFLWYRPVYNAFMKEVSLYYFFFFVFNGFHIAYTFYMAVGIPNTGGAGLILLVTLFTDNYIAAGVFTLLASICWIVMGVLAVYLYIRTYNHYKAAGHTLSEAKKDAMVHIGKSDAARGVAMSAAKQSFR
ncbi:scamp-domain-containing protein [Hesseltinella vesiculosa]|uniref:Scamp-domain-containing protein n=1 Tax=Hesseltinella vesiculosa TaxID=101127 RepID=A0A1X2GG11_9FUNG|nr:scamp-domain-containing protein [Hesseltinella vesiculosa]